jgi:hypothetical protein
VNKDNTEITGNWTQEKPVELNFKRVPEKAAPKPAAQPAAAGA